MTNEKSKLKVYISGKMRGLTTDKIFEKFEKSSLFLAEKGYSVMNPAIFCTLPFIDHFTVEDFLSIDFAMIDCCDAVFVQKDWKTSEGAKQEIKYAICHDKELIWEE